MKEIVIGQRLIGKEHKPFIIAEMSGNHNQSLERALEIIDVAAKAGADAVKLQTYTADTMTIDKRDGEFFIDDPKSLWHGKSLYELYQIAYTPWEWHKPIMDHCRKLGILCFSTPFDETAVDFLEELDVPCYKVASFENTDVKLLEKVAKTGKPLIVSTGMAGIADIDLMTSTIRNAGCEEFILLKCTSSYPAPPNGSNLLTIPHLQAMCNCQVGLSDHTLGVGVAVASIALGATVIEKHFTLSRAEGGVDAAFSLEPEELKSLVIETERAWQALGQVSYGVQKAEQEAKKYRRSLYIVEDVAEGETLSMKNIRAIRPGYGLQPKHLEEVLGRKVKKDVARGTALSWELLV